MRAALVTLRSVGLIDREDARGRTPAAFELCLSGKILPGKTAPIDRREAEYDLFDFAREAKSDPPTGRREANEMPAKAPTTILPTKKVSKYGVFREACGEALASNPSHEQVVESWLADGFSAEHIAAVLKARSQGKPSRSIVSWRYFDQAVREAIKPATAPAAAVARGLAGKMLPPSAPKTPTRDPWSYQAKEQATALLQSEMGMEAARENWIAGQGRDWRCKRWSLPLKSYSIC